MNKIFSQKKYLISLIVVLLFIIGFGSYTLVGVYRNVKQMDSVKDTDYYPAYPTVATTGKDKALIQRGEYLAKAGDCIACHTDTKKKGKPFAGGLPMHTPFGTIYSPNITGDKATGIGRWTDAQFIKAMREGISPRGTYYYPAFPYLYFNKISDADLLAIKAYLDSVPSVDQANRKNEMLFPFNIRFLQLGWRILFFHKENTGPYQDNPHQSADWNRGAYLVAGLGHCAMCHTPSHHLVNETFPLAAPIRRYDLTGAKIQGYLAPNITQSNFAKVPDMDIIAVFTQDKLVGGGKIQGPMLEVNRDSLHHLSASDLASIAKYLKTVHSEAPPKPKGGPGKGTYEANCSGCHATGSGGSPKFGDSASWEPIIKAGFAKAYANAIHGIGDMPAKGSCLSCSDDEIKQAVAFMFNAVQGGSGAGGSATGRSKPALLSLADEKQIYDKNCSVCHNSGFKGAPIPGDKRAWQPIVDAGFIAAYQAVALGQKDHPVRGACQTCTDADLKAAVKYMMQVSSDNKDYHLW